MKKVLLMVAIFLTAANSCLIANDSCRILYNKQVIYQGSVDDEAATAVIRSREIRNTDCMTIIYRTEKENRGWKRTIYLEDSVGQNIKTVQLGKQNGIVTVKGSVLSALKKKNNPILVSTMSLPTDKALAARIRVRRVFICKIGWN